MAVFKFLDLSTAHISKFTDEQLEKAAWLEDNAGNDLLPFRVLQYEYGYIIFVPGEIDKEEEMWENVQPDLVAIIEEAKKESCDLIRLDNAADELHNLQKFEW